MVLSVVVVLLVPGWCSGFPVPVGFGRAGRVLRFKIRRRLVCLCRLRRVPRRVPGLGRLRYRWVGVPGCVRLAVALRFLKSSWPCLPGCRPGLPVRLYRRWLGNGRCSCGSRFAGLVRCR